MMARPTLPLPLAQLQSAARDGVRKMRRGLSRAELQEIVAEAVFRTWKAAPGNPQAFAVIVARRLAIDLYRARGHAQAGAEAWEGLRERRDTLLQVEQGLDAFRALSLLSEDKRAEVLAEDMPADPHARDALYKRRARAVAWLRQKLEAA